ncbi:MAG: serine hydrolase domain-containing protein [Massilia sp.]
MLKLTPVCFAALLLSQAPAAFAQNAGTTVAGQSLAAQIDAAIAPYFKPGDPGATIIVTRDGKRVFYKSYGLADVAKQQAMKLNMDFQVGAIAKQFAAAAIMLLVDDRQLALDDDIRKYLPGFPDKGSKITIEHLLTHTSGIVDHGAKPEHAGNAMNLAKTPAQLIATFKDDPLEFAPGSRSRYSDAGYVLLGAIIEKISEQPYAQFVAERIFVPLEMNDTACDRHERAPRLPALPHVRSGDAASAWVAAPSMNMSQACAAGTLVSTIDDLAKWNRTISRGRLLRPASWARVFTPFKLNNGEASNYGYGWEVGSLRGHALMSQGGAINGYSAYTMRLPQDRVDVAVLSNADAGSGVTPPFEVASKAAAIAIGQP